LVPALSIFLGHSQVEAEATSLLVIVPVAIVGTWRQYRLGNVRLSDGAIMGLLSIPGVVAGVAIANAVSQRALEIGFAAVALIIAAQLAHRSLRPAEPAERR